MESEEVEEDSVEEWFVDVCRDEELARRRRRRGRSAGGEGADWRGDGGRAVRRTL